jgi:hypothetical protein
MSPKLVAFVLLVFVALTSQATRGAATSADAKTADGSAGQPADVARQVFQGSQFWWKHRSTVEDPTIEIGFLARLREPIRAVIHFLGRLLGQILEFLARLIPGWSLGLGGVTGATGGLVWGLGALALAIISWMIYRSFRARRLAAEGFPAEPIQESERLPDALVLIGRARAALEAGDTFEALRLGFQAILAGLEDRGIVRYDPARTNSEYLRDLRPQPALAAGFRRVAVPFERAFYGKIRPEPIDVERALEFCQSLMTTPMVST